MKQINHDLSQKFFFFVQKINRNSVVEKSINELQA